ncbi:ribokinase [Agromyces kandeliae]|uniref:Ribokinase n=1 Tax=Agromyces kandeliae TaxID=2666141 RepID=A0A6L5R4J3_9MICO|nr:ribokinase [Agromyces kandeliae]MRX44815.1 ribokinase [Agromyces kandeliae]
MVSSEVAVAVVGSVNVDVTLALAKLPVPGETVVATGTRSGPGGKGANQAIWAAATRADIRTYLIAAVGTDAAGSDALAELGRHAVDTTYVARTAKLATGRAFVSIDADGENSIVVVAGANAGLTASHVRRSLDAIASGNPERLVVVCQGEVPIRAIEAAARFATEHDVPFVLNLAPVRELPRSALRAAGPLILNETEARSLASSFDPGAPHPSSVQEAAGVLHRELGVTVIVTRGASGVHMVDKLGIAFDVPGVPAERVVDTTGAGDAFVGAFAASRAAGASVAESVEAAVAAGARAVCALGATAASLMAGATA